MLSENVCSTSLSILGSTSEGQASSIQIPRIRPPGSLVSGPCRTQLQSQADVPRDILPFLSGTPSETNQSKMEKSLLAAQTSNAECFVAALGEDPKEQNDTHDTTMERPTGTQGSCGSRQP